MTITEDLREKARRLDCKIGFSCSKYLADEFGIECGEVSCGECYARLFERIADRVEAETDELRGLRDENEKLRDMVREPQLPDGVEWPRFEDGGLVKVGDEIEHGGKAWEVDAICFDREGWSMALSRNLDISRMSGSYGEPAKRPTPKVLDADGVPIRVGDTVYFADGNRSALIVERIDANGGKPAVDLVYAGERIHWHSANPEKLTHEPPDSWERLEEDAAKRVCEYAGAQKSIADADRYTCLECPYDEPGPHTDAGCHERMRLDLVRRAKALAKAGGVE